MNNLHYRPTFDLDSKNEIGGKNLLKVVKFHNLVEKRCIVWKIYSLTKFANYLIIVLRVRKLLPFLSRKW